MKPSVASRSKFGQVWSAAKAALPDGRLAQVLLLMAMVMGVTNFARLILNPIQEAVQGGLQLSDNQIAMVQGPALAIPMALAAIPLGLAADRFSRVVLLRILIGLTLIGTIFTSLATSLTTLVIARCMVGFATAVNPVIISLLADCAAPAVRGRSTMLLGFGQMLGLSAVFAAGGLLLDYFGGSWQSSVAWMSLPFVFAFAALFAIKEPARTTSEARTEGDSLGIYMTFLPRIALPMLGVITVEIAYGAILVWTSPAFSRTFDLPPGRIGSLMAGGLLVSSIIGPIAGGFIADHCQKRGGPRLTIKTLCVLSVIAAPVALYPLATSLWLALAGFVAFKTLMSCIAIMGMSVFTVLLPSQARGMFIGALVTGTVIFSGAIAPLLVSALSGLWGPSGNIALSLALVSATVCLIGAFQFAIGFRIIDRVSRTSLDV